MKKTILLFIVLVSNYAISQNIGGEGPMIRQETPCLNPEQRQEIFKLLSESREKLKKEGLYEGLNKSKIVSQNPSFIFPVEQAEGFNYESTWGISNYVDHNPIIGRLTDYNCGEKTYDTENDYHHQGIDIFTWPFTWNQLDNNQTKIVAAASGQIIFKSDGNFDKNCDFNFNFWNAIYIEHSDGSVAWYGHIKERSLTSKSVGDFVSQGEFLGSVGSSGNSTGPHLHFEVYDSNDRLIDPYSGPCNSFNSNSWWANQKDYENPKINALLTHSQRPVISQCYGEEELNIKNNFDPNDFVFFGSYFTDQQVGSTAFHSVYTPSGALYTTWRNDFHDYYFSSYWFRDIQVSDEEGVWTFTTTYKNQTVSHNFTVGDVATQSAYTTHKIPGIIQAEAYDNGGQGVAYNDIDTANRGRQGRLNEGVDIQNTNDNGGGTYIGWTNNGEWLEYTIRNVESGTYNLDFRVASNNSNAKSFEVLLDNANLGTIAINNTGGWQNWATVTLSNVSITRGTNKILRLNINGGSINFNYVDFKKVNSSTDVPIGQYISLQKSGGDLLFVAAEDRSNRLIADRTGVGRWEKFLVEAHPNGGIALKANANGLYVKVPGFDTNQSVLPKGVTKGSEEQFEWKKMSDGKVAIKSVLTGKWLQASWSEDKTVIRAKGEASKRWETFNWKIESTNARRLSREEHSKTINTSFKLYPNPANNLINIKFEEQPIQQNKTLILINGFGLELRAIKVKQINESIDISNLPSGLYFIKIKDGNEIYNKKFIKR